MLGALEEYDLTDDPTEADVIIVNTCGFIEAAKTESLSTILDLHGQRRPDSLLVVSGCLSERYREELTQQLPEVDIFTGVGDYEQIAEMIREKRSRFSPSVYLADEHSPRLVTGSNYHAYIKIAEGCNQNCSFCAIPSFKGRLQSRTIDSISSEISALARRGYRDFSLISQDSSSYGRDLSSGENLTKLIEGISRLPAIRSARVLYLYPSTVTAELIDAIASSTVFQSYYDMPIQHIDDRMLKIMKRGFGESKTRRLLEQMRSKKNGFVRTSVIAGHPGESEESFKKLCDFLEEFGFDRINVFAYSNEEDTVSYGMPQLPADLIEERTSILGEIAQRSRDASLERMVGREVIVAIDGTSEEHEYLLSARPLLWAPEIDGEILVNDPGELPVRTGGLYRAKITQKAGDYLMATLLHEIRTGE